jgi:hypothetical protein
MPFPWLGDGKGRREDFTQKRHSRFCDNMSIMTNVHGFLSNLSSGTML